MLLMSDIKKLPAAEFEIMKVVWANEAPITTNIIMEQLGNRLKWKAPTVITLMLRLVDRGFLRTEKNGKERIYYPLISKEEYLKIETKDFMKTYHENSLLSFVNTFYDGKRLNDQEIAEVERWLQQFKDV